MGLGHSPRIVTDGLVLCLDAANKRSYPGTGTTWTDRSASGNHGALANEQTFDSDNGGSIVFDGADDWITMSSSASDSYSDLTASTWVYPQFFYQAYGRTIVAYTNDCLNQRFALEYGRTTNKFDCLCGNKLVYSDALSNDNWYNVVSTSTYNGSIYTHTLYINGQFSNSGTSTVAPFGGKFYIGWYANCPSLNNSRWLGKISTVSIYNRALTADEVRQNFEATKGRYE